jgi:hypothetical protein
VNEYTASNGAQVVLTNAGQTGYILAEVDDTVSSAYLGFEQMKAWREFARAEEDERLGRWRFPENPDYVVYPADPEDEDGAILILFEPGGGSSRHYTRKWLASVHDPDGWVVARCARAYFDAHPEPKPAWHDAKAGELWAVSHDGGDEYPYRVDAEFGRPTFEYVDGLSNFPVADPRITSGRRIWPEAD